MEFKSLRNIEASFKQIRFFTLVFIVLCTGLTGYSVYCAYAFAEAQRQKIYVLDNGKSLILALSQDIAQNRPVEIRAHVRLFHELFFSLAPDKLAIEDNIKRSLYMADKSVYLYYTNLSEQQYYNRIISANINQKIRLDSIVLDINYYPYKATTYARQFLFRETSITIRNLITSCLVTESTRSDNNPFGLMIEKFSIIDNKDLQKLER